MKLKIRGLIFTGFAAAVFAQSALAVESDDKTVTSKTYVDSKIEASSGGATTIGPSSGEDKAPSSQNVYLALQAVQTQVSGIDVVSGNETYVSVTEGSGNNAGTFTVSTAQIPATTNAGITGELTETNGSTLGTADKLVTAGAVKSLIDTGLSDAANAEDDTTMPTSAAVVSYAEKKANKATSISTTSGGNYTSNTEYPTTKAVYDFVTGTGTTDGFQPKTHVGGSEDNNTLKVGKGEGQWGVIQAYGQGDPNATNNYLEIQPENGRDVYNIGIVPSKIAQHGADGTSSGTAYTNQIVPDSDSLTTANAVYEYVQNNVVNGDLYQPKIANGNVGKVMIGYNTATTNGGETTYSSDWRELVGDYMLSNNVYNGGYIQVAPNPENANRADVRLLNVGHGASDITNATAAQATNNMDALASAYAVQQYAVKQQWQTTDNGKHLVIGSDGKVTLSTNTNPDIPAPTDSRCVGENSTHVCALVAYYDATATGGIRYEWTVMAPTGN